MACTRPQGRGTSNMLGAGISRSLGVYGDTSDHVVGERWSLYLPKTRRRITNVRPIRQIRPRANMLSTIRSYHASEASSCSLTSATGPATQCWLPSSTPAATFALSSATRCTGISAYRRYRARRLGRPYADLFHRGGTVSVGAISYPLRALMGYIAPTLRWPALEFRGGNALFSHSHSRTISILCYRCSPHCPRPSTWPGVSFVVS